MVASRELSSLRWSHFQAFASESVGWTADEPYAVVSSSELWASFSHSWLDDLSMNQARLLSALDYDRLVQWYN